MEPPRTSLIVSSPEFTEGGLIPNKFTCKGEGVNPTLVIDQVPEGTESMVLILDDPDAPNGCFTHWVLFDIQPTNSIEENTSQGVSGLNSRGKMGYIPPCPPAGIHRYCFQVFALRHGLNLRPGADRIAIKVAMEPYILAHGVLTGKYGREVVKEAVNQHSRADRTIVDETGAGGWTSDKKAQHD